MKKKNEKGGSLRKALLKEEIGQDKKLLQLFLVQKWLLQLPWLNDLRFKISDNTLHLVTMKK